MFYYAQLNDDYICIGISSLINEVESPKMILLGSYDEDYLWRKYQGGNWSQNKFKPEDTDVAPDELEELKVKVRDLEEYLDEHEAALIEIVNMIVGGDE